MSTSAEEAINQHNETSNKKQFLAAFAATVGNLIMGTCISWSGPAIPNLNKPYSQDGFNVDDAQKSWIGSLMPLGALFGGPVGGFLIKKVGKKGAMLMNAFIFASAYLLIVVAQDLWFIYIGRFISGLATGVSSLVCPVYIAEIAKPEIRGFLGSCVQVMVTIGIFLTIAIGSIVSWRWLSVGCLIAVVIWSFLLLLIPDSPAQYLADNKPTEAKQALEWLRGTSSVDREFSDIQKNLDCHIDPSTGVKDFFKPENLAPLIISMYLMLGQQFSGMNAVIFYVVDIFDQAGSSIPSSYESIIVAIVQVVATVIGALVMDKLGRRILLNTSSMLMVVSLAALGSYFYIKDSLGNIDLATKLHVLPVASLSIFVFGFSFGFGPIPWLMMSELFGPDIRSRASSLATSFNWFLAFLVTKFFSNIVDLISEAWSFWLFGGVTLLTFFFCLLFVPETKGKSLEKIQTMFKSNGIYFMQIGIWKMLRHQPTEDRTLLIED